MRVSGPVQAAVMEMGTRMKMQGTKRSGKPWTSLGAPSMEVCFCRLQTLSVSCEGKVGLVSALETPGWAMRDASTAPPQGTRNLAPCHTDLISRTPKPLTGKTARM
jgi:hypothetical protein